MTDQIPANRWDPDGCPEVAAHLYNMADLGPAQCHLEPGHPGPHVVDPGTPHPWYWGGPELDDITDDELRQRQLAAAQRFESDDEFAARITTLADWAQRVDLLRGIATGDRTLQYRMAIGMALDTEWEPRSPDRIEFDASPQMVKTDGDRVAWRNESHEPGRWFLIDESRWIAEAEVADWEALS